MFQVQGVSMKPAIVVYCCANSTAAPEETVERLTGSDQADVKLTRLPCTGRTDVLYMLKAIEDGADLALVVACPEGQCQFLEGNLRAKKRVGYVNRLLAEAGLGEERVRMVNMDPNDTTRFETALQEAVAKAREIGPWLRQKER
jgi:F420-non-reducing hydrogenase iron-sulfur subunit